MKRYEHKNNLVYYEEFKDIMSVIIIEKQIMGGSRQKRIDLNNTLYPEFKDLYNNF